MGSWGGRRRRKESTHRMRMGTSKITTFLTQSAGHVVLVTVTQERPRPNCSNGEGWVVRQKWRGRQSETTGLHDPQDLTPS